MLQNQGLVINLYQPLGKEGALGMKKGDFLFYYFLKIYFTYLFFILHF